MAGLTEDAKEHLFGYSVLRVNSATWVHQMLMGSEYHLFLRFLNHLMVRPYTEYATQPLLGANYS